MQNPPANLDVRNQLKQRLMELHPRAFELFASDLLIYVGLKDIQVTRYSGDGGIDAYGEFRSNSELMHLTTGVQVKRHKSNVPRSDIDRFIGALVGHFHYGLFITTAGYASTADVKANQSIVHIDTINGQQIVDLMVGHNLGLSDDKSSLDEVYFTDFEQKSLRRVSEQKPSYDTSPTPEPQTPDPADDLISLRALSYALRIDTTTIRAWIETGKLVPDRMPTDDSRTGFFFRRDRIETIRREIGTSSRPESDSEWRQAFVDFARSRQMSKSYKPVLLKTLFKVIDRNGVAAMADVVQAFLAFYIERERQGLELERGASIFAAGASVPFAAIKNLIIRNPLERFIIKGFLEYDAQADEIRFAPQLWQGLRAYELMDILVSVDEQLQYYYNRGV